MIKLLVSISGQDFSHNYGEIVDLGEDYEARLIETGQAEAVKTKKAAKNEAKTNNPAK